MQEQESQNGIFTSDISTKFRRIISSKRIQSKRKKGTKKSTQVRNSRKKRNKVNEMEKQETEISEIKCEGPNNNSIIPNCNIAESMFNEVYLAENQHTNTILPINQNKSTKRRRKLKCFHISNDFNPLPISNNTNKNIFLKVNTNHTGNETTNNITKISSASIDDAIKNSKCKKLKIISNVNKTSTIVEETVHHSKLFPTVVLDNIFQNKELQNKFHLNKLLRKYNRRPNMENSTTDIFAAQSGKCMTEETDQIQYVSNDSNPIEDKKHDVSHCARKKTSKGKVLKYKNTKSSKFKSHLLKNTNLNQVSKKIKRKKTISISLNKLNTSMTTDKEEPTETKREINLPISNFNKQKFDNIIKLTSDETLSSSINCSSTIDFKSDSKVSCKPRTRNKYKGIKKGPPSYSDYEDHVIDSEKSKKLSLLLLPRLRRKPSLIKMNLKNRKSALTFQNILKTKRKNVKCSQKTKILSESVDSNTVFDMNNLSNENTLGNNSLQMESHRDDLYATASPSKRMRNNFQEADDYKNLVMKPINFQITHNLFSGNRVVKSNFKLNCPTTQNSELDKQLKHIPEDFNSEVYTDHQSTLLYEENEESEVSDHASFECSRNWTEYCQFSENDIIKVLSDEMFKHLRLLSEDELLTGSSNKLFIYTTKNWPKSKVVINRTNDVENNSSCTNVNSEKENEVYTPKFSDSNNMVTDWLATLPNSIATSQFITERIEYNQTPNYLKQTSISKEESHFKTPLLPCAKRPPTRIKSNHSGSRTSDILGICSSRQSTEMVQVENNSTAHIDSEHDDDAISIFAESVLNFGQTPNILAKDSNLEQHIDCDSVSSTSKPTLAVPSTSKPTLTVVEHQLNSISQEDYFKYNNIPIVFGKYCVHYFSYGCGLFTNCRFYHEIQPKLLFDLHSLPLDQLILAYKFAKTRPRMYNLIVEHFINTFESKKHISGLIDMVADVLKLITKNKTPYVEKVITALLSFNYTLDYIVNKLVEMNEKYHTCLSDILLEILCKDKDDLNKNWGLIIKLIELRNTEPIDHGVITRMIIECITFHMEELSKKIVTDIITTAHIKFQFIDVELLRNFYSLLCSLGFMNEAHVFKEKVAADNISLQLYSHENQNECYSSNQFDETDFNNCMYSQLPDYEVNLKALNSNLNLPVCYTENGHHSTSTSVRSMTSVLNNSYCNYNEVAIPKDTESLSDKDKDTLKHFVECKDIVGFSKLLKQFKNTPCREKCVQYIISVFKKQNPMNIFIIFLNTFNGLICLNNYYTKDEDLEKLLDELCVNTIPILEKSNMYKEATELIIKFGSNIQPLIKVKWLNVHKHKYSEVGKYLYLCKILIRGCAFQQAFDILTSPDLNLLCGSSMWTVPSINDDVNYRNNIIKEFIISSLKRNVSIAKELVLTIITRNHITGINIWKYFNLLILNMVDNGTVYLEDIKNLLKNILEGWFNYLTKPVMRGLLIVLAKNCSSSDFIKLYDLCSKKGYYPAIKGNDRVLSITTDYIIEELSVIMYVFLCKSVRNPYKLDDLKIHITLPNNAEQPKILLNSNVHIQQQILKLHTVLARSFNFIIAVPYNNVESFVKIEKSILQKVVKSYCDSKLSIW